MESTAVELNNLVNPPKGLRELSVSDLKIEGGRQKCIELPEELEKSAEVLSSLTQHGMIVKGQDNIVKGTKSYNSKGTQIQTIEFPSPGPRIENHFENAAFAYDAIDGNGEGTVSNTKNFPKSFTYVWRNLEIIQKKSISKWKKLSNCIFATRDKKPVPQKHLLKNVSGIAYPGELLAILGSSGAGKTTLLNALAFRPSSGVQVSPSTVRMLNGYAVDAKEMQARCAYVQQDDLFIGSLTAREHLIFQAMLRMPRNMPYCQKVQRVDQVIHELSLGKCQNTLIGVPGRIKGLSGGERKRLAFASEALTDPPLLICDEPTSGLDSFMAHSVVQVLKKLSQMGKTVILTIHQPSSELFELFDKILLMAEGRVAFLGTPTEATDFFTYLGVQCPSNKNPADLYVQVLAVVPGREIESRDRIAKICDNFAVGRASREMEQNFHKIASKADGLEITDDSGRLYNASWFMQLRAVFWRTTISLFNDPGVVKHRLIQTTVISFLFSLIFFKQELSQDGVTNINGALYVLLIHSSFKNAMIAVTLFTVDIAVFMREYQSCLYRCDTYYLGKTFAEMPFYLASSLILTSITYPMIGFYPDFWHFLNTLALIILVTNAAVSFGYIVSCASVSTSMALSVMTPALIPSLLVGGLFLTNNAIPYYLKWLKYLSWFRYGNEGLLINQWADVQPGEIICTNSRAVCPRSGREVVEAFDFSVDHLFNSYLSLIFLIFVFRVLANVALVIRTKYLSSC